LTIEKLIEIVTNLLADALVCQKNQFISSTYLADEGVCQRVIRTFSTKTN